MARVTVSVCEPVRFADFFSRRSFTLNELVSSHLSLVFCSASLQLSSGMKRMLTVTVAVIVDLEKYLLAEKKQV